MDEYLKRKLRNAWFGANIRADWWAQIYNDCRHWPKDRKLQEGLRRRFWLRRVKHHE